MNQSQFRPSFILNTSDPAYIRDPYPTYRWLRENAPAYVWPGNDAVVFTRYRDVKAIFGDLRFTTDFRTWEHASVERRAPEHAEYHVLIDNWVLSLPEIDHVRVRKLVSVALTRKSLEQLRGRIKSAVDEALSAAIEDEGEGDTLDIRRFADSLPLRIIGDMFKIPPELQADFQAFGRATTLSINPTLSPEAFAQTIAGMHTWIGMLRGLIAERRKRPLPEDLLSMLIAARDNDARLSENEMLALIHALLTAGTDSAVHAICFAVYTFLRHPEALAELRRDPTLLRNAVEESLRFDPFNKSGNTRFCLEAMEFNGVPLRRGQMISLFRAAALRDPEVFPEPDRFDIRRDLSQAINFGFGSHLCLGAALARMELEIATSALMLERFPAMALLEEPVFEDHYLFRPMKRLMVRLR